MKKNVDVVRAWKDPKYRAGLSEEELSTLPAHPAGIIDLGDAELGSAHGGTSILCWTVGTVLFSCRGTCPSETCSSEEIWISA